MKRLGLKSLRAQHDLTQDQMAERCGCDRITYWRVESGRVQGTIQFWLKVQKAFNLTGAQVWELLTNDKRV